MKLLTFTIPCYNSQDYMANADLTSNTTINKSWGVGVVTNEVAGYIAL